MTVYLISYDLSGDRKAYASFYKRLKDMGCRSPLTGVQFVETNKQSGSLFIELSDLIGSEDRILIVEIKETADWFSYNTPNDHWLRDRVPQG
ncbi:hypothetical protein C7I84_22330 [Mesorhizobium ephedrae]|jgi:hypothetical protein|uniref:Uncharacterized protein n=1 Tax=Kumtagia ephedrae TaxID=2116701 RepID=A0A2P7S064_9HYPH|nr:hypothetical protein C7I84_22330 [Mesorhizobium ephedrae]